MPMRDPRRNSGSRLDVGPAEGEGGRRQGIAALTMFASWHTPVVGGVDVGVAGDVVEPEVPVLNVSARRPNVPAHHHPHPPNR